MSGATTDATRFRRIYPQASNFHDGLPGTGVRFFYTTDATIMGMTENYNQVQDVAAKLTINGTGTRRQINLQATNAAAIGCLSHNGLNSGSGGIDAIFGNLVAIIVNCCAFENELEGFRSNGNATIYNCTAIGNTTDGFDCTATSVLVKNCLSHGNGGADFTGTYSSSSVNNASEDATGDDVGSNCRASQTFTFEDAGSDDYHLASGDSGAKDFGTDLSADGTYAFDDDIDRVTRSGTWDIGFDETAAAAGRTTKNTRAFPLGTEIGMGWVMPTQV
jgi:hypothetical protein